MKKALAAVGLLIACCLVPGCGDDLGSAEQDSNELQDLYRDFRNLDLNDLLHVTAGWATKELNSALVVTPFAQVKLSETEIYALPAVAANDHTVKDINQLVTGLVDRYGYRELTTEVNLLRKQHLESSGDDGYAESAFRIRAGLHNWGFSVGGFGNANVTIGFDAGVELQARVIRTVDRERDAYISAPLAAITETRSFILPRSIEDLQALKPGESHALRGTGRLGVNLGVGVPILVTSFESLTYNLVLSGALRTMLEGEVDVQVVRLAGDDIAVDVGIEQASVRSAVVALEDGWGVHGLMKSHIKIAGIDLDLGRLVEKALERHLNAKLNLVSASLSKTKRKSRLSVARFRVDLSKATPGSPIERALEHALKADIRLAQALSNRYEPGIVAEFELSRSGVSAASYAGIDLLGMSFFRKVNESSGQVTIQTPGGARSVFFDSLHKSAGWLFSSHGYTRVGLSGMVFDVEHPEGGMQEANVILQIVEGDQKMERDKMLDHLDGVILGIGGERALAAIERHGNALERFVEKTCPSNQAFDPCRDAVLDNATVKQLRAQGIAALESEIAGLEPAPREVVWLAGHMRLTAQATYEPKATWTGPPTSVVLDYRLDDRALSTVLGERSRAELETAMRNYLNVSHLDRFDMDVYSDQGTTSSKKARADLWSNAKGEVSDAGKVFAKHQERYRAILEAERLVLPKHPELGEMGPVAIEVRFPVDSSKTPDYEKAVARSLARARSSLTTSLVDELIDSVDVKGIDTNAEQTIAYTLLALTPDERLDVRLDVDLDVSDSWEQGYSQYRKAGYESFDIYGKGTQVSRIDGGLFDIDTLVDVD